jgi:hypothetical protein
VGLRFRAASGRRLRDRLGLLTRTDEPDSEHKDTDSGDK